MATGMGVGTTRIKFIHSVKSLRGSGPVDTRYLEGGEWRAEDRKTG